VENFSRIAVYQLSASHMVKSNQIKSQSSRSLGTKM